MEAEDSIQQWMDETEVKNALTKSSLLEGILDFWKR